ncbi:hypothetical protein GLS40_15980 [Pseudooceanicola sp. 216_PA32_1]|uniref:Uncharacterized protein n=1 Tax=Pseudooceanicola pacificus TaxID=2676438 RepID=A0A844WDE7_9RHOB|nr:hypothetical protein [Pseudooceanicola pacificus]MWB79533.1 hypothetical protein [Pseudooceanicola pacificus]
MTLQNRVLPTQEIVADPARGTMTGNRGILHRPDRTLGRARWKSRAWICCTLHWRDVRRSVMSPGTWTELFFLDEAVALAAGHRPCAYCRRAAYTGFRDAWAAARGPDPKAVEMDRILHEARLTGDRRQRHHDAPAESLPEGVFILWNSRPALLGESALLPFTTAGYGPELKRPRGQVTVITPAPTVAVLRAGYRPKLHQSASPGAN